MVISSIKKNLIYNWVYQILIIILPLITTPYISRILGADNIGIYSYGYSIAYYFMIFIMLGLNNYGNRTIATVRNNYLNLSKTFCSIYCMQIVISIIMIFIYIVMCKFILKDIINWIMLIYVISASLDINWFFFGIEEFKLTVSRNIVVKILSTILIFVFVKTQNDIYLYVLIMAMGTLLSQLLLWPFIKKYVTPRKISLSDIVIHIKPNLILFIPVIAVSLYKIMDKIMLGNMSTMTEVGFYESSEKITQIPLALVVSLGTVMLPRISNLIANHKETKSYFNYSIKLAMFLSTSICFGIMAVADIFVPIFYGAGYEKCIILFRILLPSCIFLSLSDVIRTQHLIPMKKDRIFIYSVSLGALVNIIINIILIPIYNSIGAAIGTLLAEITVCLYQVYIVRKEINIKQYLFSIFSFTFSGILMFVVVSLIPNNKNIIFVFVEKITIGIIVYFLSLYIQFKCFNIKKKFDIFKSSSNSSVKNLK